MIKPQTLKGFRDFLPEEKRRRDYVLKKIIEVFELFGFDPLETPTLEYASLLLSKYGKEADKLIYTFKDRGGRDVALRYDQTVPSARVLSQYQNTLSKYFRRYQIQNVFRADNPQKGRYREFTQCDIDIFGSASPIADAEIIATTYFAFKNIGYPTVKILVNDRQTLFAYLEPFTDKKVDVFSLIQTVDKFEKIGKEEVVDELVKKGLTKDQASQALFSIQSAKISQNLQTILNYTISLGVPKEFLVFTPTLARGLDYYTGMIFEVILPEYTVGSCGGGGRYDKLIEQLGGINIPAVGIAFGFDRMVDAANHLKIIPQEKSGTRVLVCVFNEETVKESLSLAKTLRESKISTEVLPSSTDKLDKQIKYADKKGIAFVAIIGPDEAKNNTVTLKSLKDRTQQTIPYEKISVLLKQ
ncbi:histidine--tRNA ligase [Candidatus Gottesmanbacteria bacterium CG11_big_fil_rev_8_21_14_0_20_37_11]|uniref:Histidine--tRNA ligase n=2 Tax=Microgenomates group TaxID=1794810 RepID=A0A2H0NIQ7_9BACT|nr:MAG: histidine--tRNA ligase [Candidatus Gottesmanbacteria bacterium CG11_big_fil_rev_8_21_14_0_20_37_11]PJC32556.1 MAG: histidine--tRNA ligase [Candidatus Roizmanbacteria bacterium CG_4_9_14_0_2_um_filter_36_12]